MSRAPRAPPEDERFLVKTMRKSEMEVLLELLRPYVAHVAEHPATLITRFFGLHRLKPVGAGRSVRGGGAAARVQDRAGPRGFSASTWPSDGWPGA
jgi:hypothetical protein